MLLGILSGLMAGALWGLTFLAPKILTDYTSADIALGRLATFGMASAFLLLSRHKQVKAHLSGALIAEAALLSCLSFSVYYLALAASIKYSGTPLASLIIGLLPVSIPLLSHDKVTQRKLFGLSTAMILGGLLTLNLPVFLEASANQIPIADWAKGLSLAVFALACWTLYAFLNAKALKRNPNIDTLTWSSLTGLFAFITIIPLWLLFNTNASSTSNERYTALPYVFWMIVIGLGSSWLATIFWNFASRRIPAALAGQLIVSETIFALGYNYIYDWRIPAASEFCAAALLVAGVIVGIRSFANTAVE